MHRKCIKVYLFDYFNVFLDGKRVPFLRLPMIYLHPQASTKGCKENNPRRIGVAPNIAAMLILQINRLLKPINRGFNDYKILFITLFHYRLYIRTVLSILSPSRRREAPCEGTNSPLLSTPGETKALAKSKVHQLSRASVTNDGWSSSLISKIWRTVMNRGHWLVQFKVCIITTAWRQRNSKHFLIWWLINFLQIYFNFARLFARFCKFQERKG
jgi:hypothetical protein